MSELKILGNPNSSRTYIRLSGIFENDSLNDEYLKIKATLKGQDFCIIILPINDWDKDLTPWPAKDSNNRNFGSNASDTMSKIIDIILPEYEKEYPCQDRQYYLVGYSLAGLFALWVSYQTDLFYGIVAASPSVWYPGWLDYITEHKCLATKVYLSLGTKEHKTRNESMSKVADNIAIQSSILTTQNVINTLEWNPGNHFSEVSERLIKGMNWLFS